MDAALCTITGRRKASLFEQSTPDDFDLGPAGRIGTDALIASPDWTLYALDLTGNRALLVEMPAGSNLSAAAFVYHDQYHHGQRAAVLDLKTFIAASRQIAAPRNLSFLFSTGRCGSNLASRIFAQHPDVFSLSEPDWLGNIAMARLTQPRADLVALIHAATLWTCRQPEGHDAPTIVIKPRSEATLIAELCQEAFPSSRNVFMYRDLAGWVTSVGRFVQRIIGPDVAVANPEYWRDDWAMLMVGTPISVLDGYFGSDHGPIIEQEFHTLMWDLRIEGYLCALRRGMKFTAIHYADLDRDRAAQTARLLKGCGLSDDNLDLALRAFAKDSHSGSVTANDTAVPPLPPENLARATALLARLGKRDYVDTRLPE